MSVELSSQAGDGGFAERPSPSLQRKRPPPLEPVASVARGVDDLVLDTIVFNDGSKYTGTLKNGVPHGLGRCIWSDGNQYDGEWRNGVMHGFGTYLWTSGQRYDGEWRDGKREGIGVKQYSDGSTFDGFWKDGRKSGVGVYRPALQDKDRKTLGRTGSKSKTTAQGAAATASTTASPTAATASGAVGGMHPVESTAFILEKGAAAERDAGEAASTSDTVMQGSWNAEGSKILFIRKFDSGHLVREDKLSSEEVKYIFGPVWKKKKRVRRRVKQVLGIGKKLQQKQGQLLYKGMPGFELMSKLQLGIRYSLGRNSLAIMAPGHQSAASAATGSHGSLGAVAAVAGLPASKEDIFKLEEKDFVSKSKIFFPSAGSSTTPAHPSSDFKWKDYCPRVFRALRSTWGINDAEYMLALGGSEALRQLNSPGKSGCMFFLSDDEKFLIKTMRKTELRTLMDMLPKYYAHFRDNPSSLIIRFYGVHGVKQVHGRIVRFVVMSNIFCTDLQIHRKYDLKGSTHGRTVGQKDPNDSRTIFKDLDLDIRLSLPPDLHDRLIAQLRADAQFLQEVGVMDYSLLLGVHFCSRARKLMEEADAAAAAARQSGDGQALAVAATATAVGQGGPAGPGQVVTSGHDGQGTAHQRQHNGLQQQGQGQAVASSASHATAVLGATSSGGGAFVAGDSEDSEGEGGPGRRERTSQAQVGSPSHQQSLPHYQDVLGLSPSIRVAEEGAPAGAAGGPLAGAEGEHDKARNFETFSNKQELTKQLGVAEARMRQLGYDEQRIQDILGLAQLKILGDKLKRDPSKSRGKSPAQVLKAMQQFRQDLGLRDEDEEDELQESPREASQAQLQLQGLAAPRLPLGFNMPGVALVQGQKAGSPPEDVLVSCGIIDILQDYSLRKLLERGLKSITMDGDAISVAPPGKYAQRFINFMSQRVFPESLSLEEEHAANHRRLASGYTIGLPGGIAHLGLAASAIAEEPDQLESPGR